jgi:hypothetical protein
VLVTLQGHWRRDGLHKYKEWWLCCQELCQWDLVLGVDAIARAAGSTWWEWFFRSTLFHWQWPDFYRSIARDDLQFKLLATPPLNLRPQKDTKKSAQKKGMMQRIHEIFGRGYISPGFVTSLTSYFAVPKGDDIRYVYDASVS